jgi:epoxyqueuosine reductase QueG
MKSSCGYLKIFDRAFGDGRAPLLRFEVAHFGFKAEGLSVYLAQPAGLGWVRNSL